MWKAIWERTGNWNSIFSGLAYLLVGRAVKQLQRFHCVAPALYRGSGAAEHPACRAAAREPVSAAKIHYSFQMKNT